jgi:rubrerythrin
MAGRNYVRVRSSRLGLLDVQLPSGSRARQVMMNGDERDPDAWLAALLPVVSAAEFVEVCDRPGLTAADIAPAGDDRVRWRCQTCGHEWEARTANRTRLRTGCPPCGNRRGARIASSPQPGRSFADLHPALVSQFIENLTSPGRALDELRPNSTDVCLWRCPHCGAQWRAKPQQRHRSPSGGCSRCRFSRAATTRSGAAASIRRRESAGTEERIPGPGA